MSHQRFPANLDGSSDLQHENLNQGLQSIWLIRVSVLNFVGNISTPTPLHRLFVLSQFIVRKAADSNKKFKWWSQRE